jgi:hypothetical protein
MTKYDVSRRTVINSLSNLALGAAIVPFAFVKGLSRPNKNEIPDSFWAENPCEPLIQFDTVITSDDYANISTVLELVNQSNYENAKRSMGGKFLEYFSGSYNEFSEKRANLQKMIQRSDITFSKSNYYHHVLSSENAKIYAECVARTSNAPISAWVETKTESLIIIGIKAGEIALEYNLSGATPQNPTNDNTLTPASMRHFAFDYTSKKDFSLIITANIKATGATKSTVIIVPKVIKILKKQDRKLLHGKIKCGAGCHGSNTGCQENRDFTFTADPDYYLLESTLRKGDEVLLSGPGIRSYKVDIQKNGASKPITNLTLRPYDVEGNSKDAQGNIEVMYSIQQERIYFVEDKS